MENRVLIHAPTGKDARLIAQVFAAAQIDSAVCHNARDLVDELSTGVCALVLTAETLCPELTRPLIRYLQSQPTWSDLPILILSSRRPDTPELRQQYGQLGNVTLLERPVQTLTLVSAAKSAMRARRRQVEMREIDRRKDEFLAMLAHELRNPLAPVSSAAALLKMPNYDRARIAQTSDIILRQVKHMSALIDDLLDVSRVSRGLVTLEKSMLDVRHIIPSAVEQVRPLIDSRRHRLSIEMAAEPALVLADQKRLIQIVANLLNNAAKYTPEGGDIVASLNVSSDDVTIAVSDSGIGMQPAVMEHVFEMFAQGQRTPDRSQGGLGIGLALVKSLVHLHGGTVAASSEGTGKGSRFVVSLPRLAGTLQGECADLEEDVQSISASRRILIVDDNVDAAQALSMFLETAGFETFVEHNGFAALDRARTGRPDAFILDIGLPGMDGTVLASTLRTMPEASDATLIAITGYGQDTDAEKARKAGFDHYMVKPVDMDKLLSVLSRLPQRAA